MRAALSAALCAVLIGLGLPAVAATPAPVKSPYRIDVTKIQPKALLPKVPLHTEYVVAINKLGQVTRIVSGKVSKDRTYNLQTYGNALQAFIRTPDGKVVPGRYLLTYDYSPKTTRVHRDVTLVSAGGVDANAEGAVYRMMDDVDKHAPKKSKPASPAPPRSAAMTPGAATDGQPAPALAANDHEDAAPVSARDRGKKRGPAESLMDFYVRTRTGGRSVDRQRRRAFVHVEAAVCERRRSARDRRDERHEALHIPLPLLRLLAPHAPPDVGQRVDRRLNDTGCFKPAFFA